MNSQVAAPKGGQATEPVWAPPRAEPGVAPGALEDWRRETARLRAVAQEEGLSRSEVARRSAVPIGTLSPWYDGIYTGRVEAITERVRKWLDSNAESRAALVDMPVSPEFVATPTARRLTEALIYAQAIPEFAVVTLGAGCGKTTVARHFAATRPHVWLVTMRPSTSGRHTMLQEIAWALDIVETNSARLDRAIGARLRRNGRHTLLIVDEAQHLGDDAINQLRYFNDEFGVGIALFGNEAVHRRWGGGGADRKDKPKDGYAQILSRVGFRIAQAAPARGDVSAILDAWGIEDPEIRKRAGAIARRPGALRLVDKTLRLASMLAVGDGAALSVRHVDEAWRTRHDEELGH